MKLKDPASVGIFVVGAVLAFIAAILLFTAGPIFGSNPHTFVLYFDESVNGLEVGAPVKLRGVRIGQVKKILAHFDETRKSVQVPVTIVLEDAYWRSGRRERLRLAEDYQKKFQISDGESGSEHSNFSRSPLIVGMVGSLQMESFVTGKLFIELEYAPTSAGSYLRPDADGVPKIPTRPSNRESLSDQLTVIAEGISRIDFSAIGDSAERVLRALAAVDWIGLSQTLTGLARNVSDVIAGKDVHRIIHSSASICQNLADLSAVADDGLKSILPAVRRAFASISASSSGLSELLQPNSPFTVSAERLLRSADAAAQALRLFFELLEENPQALLFGRPTE
ncbi:MAG: MlaD family protein [Puniceicoccales bacterium]|jgi:paraquat-inducible protein B|nr:MlaD family protein [Puniceicoccales bacterium]